jgi:hypothetical protein
MGISPDGGAILCTGTDKSFVFMSLANTEPEIDAAKLSVVSSTAMQTKAATGCIAAKATAPSAPVKRRRRRTVVDNPTTVKATEKVALLQSAEQIRQDLRNSLVQMNNLIREVKAQRNKDKIIQNTMDSLRKLNLNIV